ncbi:BON domain-containing protein [Proteus hauseri]|uniref:BON domain-containing protein n=1 Tax=Proteus hauseri TaxID=183417 RepID=UPI0032DB3A7D
MKQQKYKKKLLVIIVGLSLMSANAFAETSWYGEINSGANTTGHYLSDTAISTKIKATLLPIQQIDSDALSIRTEFGHVFISGFVSSQDQETQIVQIVEKIDGVKSVDSSVNIK